jgi:hypothetical protein
MRSPLYAWFDLSGRFDFVCQLSLIVFILLPGRPVQFNYVTSPLATMMSPRLSQLKGSVQNEIDFSDHDNCVRSPGHQPQGPSLESCFPYKMCYSYAYMSSFSSCFYFCFPSSVWIRRSYGSQTLFFSLSSSNFVAHFQFAVYLCGRAWNRKFLTWTQTCRLWQYGNWFYVCQSVLKQTMFDRILGCQNLKGIKWNPWHVSLL